MSDISDLCLGVIEETLDSKLESQHGYIVGSTAVMYTANLYETLCKKLRVSTLIVDKNEQRMRFTAYINSETEKAEQFYHPRHLNISIELHTRGEIITFLHEHSPKYKIEGESDYARTLQCSVYGRAHEGVSWALFGALAISASFAFDAGYVDEAIFGAGAIFTLASFKDVKRFVSYCGRRK